MPCPKCGHHLFQEDWNEGKWYQCKECLLFFPSIRDRIKLIREEVRKELDGEKIKEKVDAWEFLHAEEKFPENASRVDATTEKLENCAARENCSASEKNVVAPERNSVAHGEKEESGKSVEKIVVSAPVEFPWERVQVFPCRAS